MSASFRETLELLNKHEVEYIVVGGVAAVIQGAPVTTFDLEALVRVSEENADRLNRALVELDARYREHQSRLSPTKEDILAGGHRLLLTRAGPLDVLGFVGDQERYDDLLDRSSEVVMSVGRFLVLDLEELVRQERRSSRAKDRAMLELLEEALHQRQQQDRELPSECRGHSFLPRSAQRPVILSDAPYNKQAPRVAFFVLAGEQVGATIPGFCAPGAAGAVETAGTLCRRPRVPIAPGESGQ